jgi:hypothetical protein
MSTREADPARRPTISTGSSPCLQLHVPLDPPARRRPDQSRSGRPGPHRTTLAALLAPSSAETPPGDIPVTVTATGLTGVVDGQVAHIHVDAPTSSIFAIEARICLGSSTIDNNADFSPTQGLNCTPQSNPLSAGTGFVQVATPPPTARPTSTSSWARARPRSIPATARPSR